MKKAVFSFSAAAMAIALAACGVDQPENNFTAEDVNAMTNLEELPPPEPAANEVVEDPAADEAQQRPAAPKPAPPPKPKPPAPEPAPDPHAGHDMNNMSH